MCYNNTACREKRPEYLEEVKNVFGKRIKTAALLLTLTLFLTTGAGATYVGALSGAGAWPVPEDKAVSDIFVDVSGAWAWAAGSVDLLYEKQIVSGIEGSFRPGDPITRGDFMLLMLRTLGVDAEAEFSGQPRFEDVPVYSVYAPAAEAAWRRGIVTGAGGLFHPRDPITRQDAFTLIYRAALAAGVEELKAGGNLSMFSDGLQVDAYAREAAANLVREGIVRGSSGRLHPLDGITRAEAAALACRLMSTDLAGGRKLSDLMLQNAGLSRDQAGEIAHLMEASAGAENLGGTGRLALQPYYLERTAEGDVTVYASLSYGGAYWCTMTAQAAEREEGFLLMKTNYIFG